jgi:hypothetical protein
MIRLLLVLSTSRMCKHRSGKGEAFMQQTESLLVFSNQRVAVPSHLSGSFEMTLDVIAHPTDPREGFVTIDGRQGWVVQSYPPIPDGHPDWFLYQWLDQPGVVVR